MTDLTRREFVKGGTAATAALLSQTPLVYAGGQEATILTTLPETPGRSGHSGPLRIALILRDLHHALPQFTTTQLKDLFGFTAAESRVANALLAGQSVEEISQASQVRRDTVRAHVKRMLAKTGSRRQSDLQKLLVKALPNLRSLHTHAAPEEF